MVPRDDMLHSLILDDIGKIPRLEHEKLTVDPLCVTLSGLCSYLPFYLSPNENRCRSDWS